MSVPPEDEPVKEHGRTRSPLFLIAGFFLLGLALALLIVGSQWQKDAPQPSILEQVPSLADSEGAIPRLSDDLLTIGDTPYDFTLLDLEGNEVSLADFHGRPVVLNFWATWCAPCRLEMPELQAAYTAHQDEGLVILALNQEESPQAVREFFTEEMGLTFTPLLDNEAQVAELYGVSNTLPSSIFIGPDGKIVAIHRGMLVSSQIEGYLAETMDRAP